MDKKKWINRLPVIVAFLCALAIIAMLAFTLTGSKRQVAQWRLAVEAQQKTITTLTAERDTLKNKKPEVVPCPLCPAPVLPPEPQTPLQEVLDPQNGDTQTQIDTIKKRYEEILVTYFVLRACEEVAPTDYHVIISALAQEMASVNAPGRLQYDILTSAQGSYKELYSDNACEAATIAPLQEKYKIFITAITEQFTPR